MNNYFKILSLLFINFILYTSEPLPDNIEDIQILHCFGSPLGANHPQPPHIEIHVKPKQGCILDTKNFEIVYANYQTYHVSFDLSKAKTITCSDCLYFTRNNSVEKNDFGNIIITIQCERKDESMLLRPEPKRFFPEEQKSFLPINLCSPPTLPTQGLQKIKLGTDSDED